MLLPARQSFLRLTRGLLFCGALALGWACDRASPGDGFTPSRVLRDPRLVRVDVRAPFSRFDGGFGSLLTGAGWSRPLRVDDAVSAGFALEAVALESEVLVPALAAGPHDLVLRCQPHESLRTRPLEVLLAGDGEPLVRRELRDGWQTLRFPLADEPTPGARRLLLRFREAGGAEPESTTTRRERRHWARCSALAVVPRAVDEPLSLVRALADIDLAAPRIELPPYAVLAVPVPGHATLRVSPGGVRIPGDCRLEASLWTAGRLRLRRDLAGAGVDLENAGPAPAELRIAAVDAREGPCLDGPVELSPPADWLQVRSTPPGIRAGRPNLLVYLVDTLRADAIRGEELDGPRAPRLREFARDAVEFRSAWSASSWTLPAVTTLLTGLDPRRHGVMRWDSRLAQDGPATLADRLAAGGYQTAAISQSWLASHDFGLDRGFATFVLNDQFNGLELRSQEVRRILRHFLLEIFRPEQPFFLYVHTVDPHGPYSPPPGPYRRYAEAVVGSQFGFEARIKEVESLAAGADPVDLARVRALYQGEVLYADEQFGGLLELLRATGLYDGAAVAFVSDHGEEFDEHGDFGHGDTLYEEVLEVPLLLKLPGNREGGRQVESRVSILDLPATLLALAGLPGVPGEAAFDLRAILDTPTRREAVYADLIPIGAGQSVDRWLSAAAREMRKCILDTDRAGKPRPEIEPFQDLVLDRAGGPEVAADPLDPGARRCRKLLIEYRRLRPPDASAQPWSPSEEDLARLRAVGYLK